MQYCPYSNYTAASPHSELCSRGRLIKSNLSHETLTNPSYIPNQDCLNPSEMPLPKVFSVSSMLNGVGIFRSSNHIRKPGKRSFNQGWTHTTTNNFKKLIFSIDYPKMVETHWLVAGTHTIKHCPENSGYWHTLLDKHNKRLAYHFPGLEYLNITEWQRRGVPHLHALYAVPKSLFNSQSAAENAIKYKGVQSWLDLSSLDYGTTHRGQFYSTVYDIKGWGEYLRKHMSRGVNNYQRSKDNIPHSWSLHTGRVYSRSYGFSQFLEPAQKYTTTFEAFIQIRRRVNAYQKSILFKNKFTSFEGLKRDIKYLKQRFWPKGAYATAPILNINIDDDGGFTAKPDYFETSCKRRMLSSSIGISTGIDKKIFWNLIRGLELIPKFPQTQILML